MALAVTAALLADEAIGSEDAKQSWRLAAAAAIAAGTSLWLRSVGITVIAGVLAPFAAHRRFRQGAIFLAAIVPFLVARAVWMLHHAGVSEMAEGTASGWRQTWDYYTSYGRFWKLTVPDGSVFLDVVQSNLMELLIQPARLCLFPSLGGGTPAGVMLAVALSVGIVAGLVREARRNGWRSIHFILLFSVPPVVLWNFPITTHLMMPFLPLFYAGLWLEGRYLTAGIAETFRAKRDAPAKAAAALMVLGLVLILGVAAESYVSSYRDVYVRNAEEASRTREHAEIEEWVRRGTAKDAILLSTDDVRLYLTTGRQAVWPLALSTQRMYHNDPAEDRREADHFMDAGKQAGARFWIVARHDITLLNQIPVFRERLPRLLEALPVVFRSSAGRYEVHDLACLQDPRGEMCEAVTPVLSTFYREGSGPSAPPRD